MEKKVEDLEKTVSRLEKKKEQLDKEIAERLPTVLKTDEEWQKNANPRNLAEGDEKKLKYISKVIEENQWQHYDYKFWPQKNDFMATVENWEAAKWSAEIEEWKYQHPMHSTKWVFLLEAGEEGDEVGLYPRG